MICKSTCSLYLRIEKTQQGPVILHYMYTCWSVQILLLIVAVSARFSRDAVHKTVFGIRGRNTILQCTLVTTKTTIAFIEWRFGDDKQLLYFDATKSTQNTGPKGKFERRDVKGFFGDNETLHELNITRTEITDEGLYTCRIRDSLKELYTQIIELIIVVLPSNPPAIVSRNGTRLSTSDCANTIPSVYVADKTEFFCQVGISRPPSKTFWQRIFPMKEKDILPDTKGTVIQVGPLSNFLLNCTVMTPSVNSVHFTVRHICLRVIQRKQREREERQQLEDDLNGFMPWIIIVVVLVMIIIAIIALHVKILMKGRTVFASPSCLQKGKSSDEKKEFTEISPMEEENSLLTHKNENKHYNLQQCRRSTSEGNLLGESKEPIGKTSPIQKGNTKQKIALYKSLSDLSHPTSTTPIGQI